MSAFTDSGSEPGMTDFGFYRFRIKFGMTGFGRYDGCMFTPGPSTGSGTGCHLLQIPKLVRDDGIQGVELFFGDGGVLVVGGDGFVYVVFWPELA